MLRISVPATSANIGPGFDVFGLAIEMKNEFVFNEADSFEEDNLVIQAYKRTYERLGLEPEPIKVEIIAEVPMARGLGSSSTCVVAGVAAALYRIRGEIVKDFLLEIATDIEGHPDNVAPAIYGNLVVSVMDEGKVYYTIHNLHDDLKFLTIIPDFELATEKAREILPGIISRADGIYNVSRACLLVPALEVLDEEKIKVGLKDRFHEPYRKSLIPGYDEVKKAAIKLGAIGCYLSGAGPTMMCITKSDNTEVYEGLSEYLKSAFPSWQINSFKIDKKGIVVIEE